MIKVIKKVLEYNGPIETYNRSGLTFIYLSDDLKAPQILFPDNLAHAFFSSTTEEFISEKEREHRVELPLLYKELLKGCNGFVLNLGHLSFLGLDLGLWKGFTQKEKVFLGQDAIHFNEVLAPRKITNRFFVIGEDHEKNCWLGIRDNKLYTINRYGKQLEEIDFETYCVAAVEKFNTSADEIISEVRKSYRI